MNAEESDANQSKFYRVISSKPVTNAEALFDTLSKFLTKDKKRQIAMDFLDDKDLLSSRLMWVSIWVLDSYPIVALVSVLSDFLHMHPSVTHTHSFENCMRKSEQQCAIKTSNRTIYEMWQIV